MTLSESVAIAKGKIILSEENQLQIVNFVKNTIISKLSECVDYYQSQDGLIENSSNLITAAQTAKTALENSVTVGLYDMYAELSNDINLYPLPFECRNIFRDGIVALELGYEPTEDDPSFPSSYSYNSLSDFLAGAYNVTHPGA